MHFLLHHGEARQDPPQDRCPDVKPSCRYGLTPQGCSTRNVLHWECALPRSDSGGWERLQAAGGPRNAQAGCSLWKMSAKRGLLSYGTCRKYSWNESMQAEVMAMRVGRTGQPLECSGAFRIHRGKISVAAGSSESLYFQSLIWPDCQLKYSPTSCP